MQSIHRLFLLLFLVFIAQPASGIAEDLTDPSRRLERELGAGEFTAVLQHANASNDPLERDKWLERLALLQASTGSLRNAGESIRSMHDSSVRQRALEYVHVASGGNLAGGAAADFESLIQLIQSTVSPDSWEINGGPGAIDEFAGGVYVDLDGVMAPVRHPREGTTPLEALLESGRTAFRGTTRGNVRRESNLRYISLPRLEQEIELGLLAGRPISESMLVLAGLQRVRYIFVYPDTGDIVLAGPAGDWRVMDGRVVSVATDAPLLQLQDLIVLMRRSRTLSGGKFGCSITPSKENLARTQQYLEGSSARPLPKGRRAAWIAGLQESLGRQEISVFGLDARTRVGRVLVEADYHMKLIAMGLEEGVPGLESYLESVPVGDRQSAMPMSMLRWWFTLNYESPAATRDFLAFELRGPGVRVLSENELLAAGGERIHTGRSEELTARFAASFTRHFDDLALKYPIYAELRNIFDLALVVALCEEHGLFEKARWRAAALLDQERMGLDYAEVPREVDSIINYRVVGEKYIVVGVSGGVSVDPGKVARTENIIVDDYGLVRQNYRPLPTGTSSAVWWWDHDP